MFGGTVRRCRGFGGGRARARARRRRGGYRKGHAPFNLGKKCLWKKSVWSRAFRRNVVRCASYGGKKKTGTALARRNGGGLPHSKAGGPPLLALPARSSWNPYSGGFWAL